MAYSPHPLPRKSCPLWDILDKRGIRRVRLELWITKTTQTHSEYVDCVWNVMAHTLKTDSVLRRNGRVHLNRQGASVQSTTGNRGVSIGGSNAGYNMFRGSVKSTGYPLHSPVYPSPPVRHRGPSHFNWILILIDFLQQKWLRERASIFLVTYVYCVSCWKLLYRQ